MEFKDKHSFSKQIAETIGLESAIIINFGLMGCSGIYLSHVTAVLSSVIIGVGVDFSIHYIYHFKANRTK